MWYYKGEPFTSEMIEDNVGFVYIITDTETGLKYIGKKTLISKRKLHPLKGKTRKRTKIVESDWQDYYSSSDLINSLVEQHGSERFHREIIKLCKTKGELSYYEAKEQFDREVLFKPEEFMNGIIQCRIHRNHVLPKKKK